MKKTAFLFLMFSGALSFLSQAQWTIAPNGNDTYYDHSGNVGIGVTQPTARLEIVNAGNASLRVGISGNRANTHTQLINSCAVIADNNLTTSSIGAVAWDFFNNGVNPSWAGALLEHVGTGVTGTVYGVLASNQANLVFNNVQNGVIASNGANIHISPLGTVSASFLTDGTVGIGTMDTKGYKFAVNGSAIFTKAVVKLNANWPDYVFKKEYRLPSLNSVAEYIRANNHLPEMPSADSVQNAGLDLGNNQAALLKKIEELTLYIIELNKKVELLENKKLH